MRFQAIVEPLKSKKALKLTKEIYNNVKKFYFSTWRERLIACTCYRGRRDGRLTALGESASVVAAAGDGVFSKSQEERGYSMYWKERRAARHQGTAAGAKLRADKRVKGASTFHEDGRNVDQRFV